MLYTEYFSMRHYVRFSQIGSNIVSENRLYMTSSEDDENTPPQHLVSSKDALEALDICMRWMEQQEETTAQQVMLFQKLKMMLPKNGLRI